LFPANTPGPLPELHFVLSRKKDGRSASLKKELSAGQYILVYSSTHASPVSAGRKSTTFTLRLPIHRLQDWTLSFPALPLFLEKVEAGIPCQLTGVPGIADLKMLRVIRNIIACSYNGPLQDIYWDLQVSLLVMMALAGLNTRDEKSDGQLLLKPLDIEKIEATRHYLMQNMDHPPTLVMLARKMGLNDFKLKKGLQAAIWHHLVWGLPSCPHGKSKEIIGRDQSINCGDRRTRRL